MYKLHHARGAEADRGDGRAKHRLIHVREDPGTFRIVVDHQLIGHARHEAVVAETHREVRRPRGERADRKGRVARSVIGISVNLHPAVGGPQPRLLVNGSQQAVVSRPIQVCRNVLKSRDV